MNLARTPISSTRCKTSVSSALGRACPVHGPCEIQAPPSHHWLTRRGQPSCRVRRVLRSPSLGLDSPEPRTELKPRVYVRVGLTSLSYTAKRDAANNTAASLRTARWGRERKGALPILFDGFRGWKHVIARAASCCLGSGRVAELGLDLVGPIAHDSFIRDGSGPTSSLSPAIANDWFMRGSRLRQLPRPESWNSRTQSVPAKMLPGDSTQTWLLTTSSACP